ncbi:MAG TPA: hypothetical protein VNT33_16675, partial [Telluria sp.]|nr:hypothetical protein [Telluria sp.]
MLAMFRRRGAVLPGLGANDIAQPWVGGAALPEGCFAVAVDAGGRTRRIEHGARMVLAGGEQCWCVHPGPYTADLVPFKAAPEIGLRTTFAVDGADPRLAQQRFDLFVAAEVQGGLAVEALARQMQAALAQELAQGGLELPPCTTFEEWNVFRAGLNRLMYTRFGVTVDDCMPVDLGDTRDYAALLLTDTGEPAPATGQPARAAADPAPGDAAALRRLFLELPAVTGAIRLAALPFDERKALLERLDLLALAVGTMPSLGLAAPGQPLAAAAQARRAAHSRRAVAALDEAWALLARLEAGMPGQLDEA